LSDTRQPDPIEPLLRSTIGAPRLSRAQRQRQLEQLGLLDSGKTPTQLQPALSGAMLDEADHSVPLSYERFRRSRRSWSELAVVATVAVLLVVGAAIVRDRAGQRGGSEPAGIPVEQLTALSSPLAPGQGYHAEFLFHTDHREDGSPLLDWRIERWQRVLADGTEQERLVLRDLEGNEFVTYVRNGNDWSRTSGDWVVTGRVDGLFAVAPYVSLSLGEPTTAVRYLHLLPASPNSAASVETFTDERGDVTRISGMGDVASEQDNRRYGVTITGFSYELIHDPETGNLQQTRGYLASEEGIEIVIGQWDFQRFEALPADSMDAALFEVAPEPEFPQYDAPEQLPNGFALDSHSAGTMSGGERLVYVGSDTQLIINVYPSQGGYDPSGLIAMSSAQAVIETVQSAAGPVTWVAGEAGVPPAGAYWDDGRYYFELSLVGAAPDGWDAATLIAVVEALSNAP
jgi:hypothetical protein